MAKKKRARETKARASSTRENSVRRAKGEKTAKPAQKQKAARTRKTDRNGKGAASGGRSRRDRESVRWAVVGLGHFAQTSVLPAFAHARENCELVALFSDDERKRSALGRKYRAAFALPYEEYDDFLRSGEVNAVYIVLPNHLHAEYTIRAAQAGVNVLCEKPMARSADECRRMIEACEEARVKLMIGYRLHFEKANMTAVEQIRKGTIGDPRYFVSGFSFKVDEDNVRTMPTAEGGGPLFDIGPYCINAARYLFQAEPLEVIGATAKSADPRFAETEEQVSAVLRFPEERLATFTVAFGSADLSSYSVVGTKGSLTLDSAYSHSGQRFYTQRSEKGERKKTFPKADQVAPELTYFARCVLENETPEPSGWEGHQDVAIIEAIMESARRGRTVALDLTDRKKRPSRAQATQKPPAEEPEPINAEAPRES